MALAMPPFSFVFFIFAGLSIFYNLLAEHKGWRAFLLGWLFGFGYFAAGLYWIGNALLVPGNPFKWVWPLAIAGLPVGLGIFTGLACYAATRLADLKTWTGFFVFAACLVVSELLRGHIFTGFPWNLYGYGWAGHLPMAQSVALIGTYGLTALTILWAALPGFLFATRAPRRIVSVSLLVLITSLNIVYMTGAHRLSTHPTRYRDDIIVRVVQPDIPQEDKWDSEKLARNLEKTVADSTGDFMAGKTYAIIWPETAVSDYVLQDWNAGEFIRSSLFKPGRKAYLISGVLRHAEGENGKPLYYNSLMALDTRLAPVSSYDKSHLVPFGEYIPYQDIIPMNPFVDFSGFTPGPGIGTEKVEGLPPYSGLVCYEVLFPGAVALKSPRPEWIINVTNDAWYGDSPGPYQHLTKAVFRAIEEGLPLARSANTGISALIDPYGRILKTIAYGQNGAIDVPLPYPARQLTGYGNYRDFPLFAVITVVFCFAFFEMRRNKGSHLKVGA
jgi:apolipoprotein N-acyltransferase